MYVAILHIKPRLVNSDTAVNLIIEANCSSCRQVKSRRGGLECDLDGFLKFLCVDCVSTFAEADREAEALIGGAA